MSAEMAFETTNNHDKDLEMFGQSIADSCNDFFQYLDFDAVEAGESSHFGLNPELTHLVSSISGSDSAGTSSVVDAEARKIDLLLQPWEGYSTDKQSTDSPYEQLPTANSLYSEATGRAAISDSELLSLEGISLSSPRLPSLPSSPTQSATKSARRRERILSSASRTFKRRSRGSQDTLRAPTHESKESPKMMSPSKYSHDWEQQTVLNAHKFDFGFPQHGLPLSPPPSARVSDASSNEQAMMFKMETSDNDFYTSHRFPNGITNYTPLTTPIVPENLQASGENQYPSAPLQSPWDPVSNPGGFPDYRTSSAFNSENEATPVWWNHAATAEVAHPAPSVYHNDGRNANKTLAMQLQNDLNYNTNPLNCASGIPSGLMIQIPECEAQQSSYVFEASPRTQQGFFAPPQHHQRNNNPFDQNSHQRLPCHRHHPNRTPSPTNTPSPKSQQQQQQQQPQSSQHSRGHSWSHPSKSPRSRSTRDRVDGTYHGTTSSTTKRSSRTPSRKSSSNNISGQRSQSMHSPVVDFVNFTPSDSMRILTGVAPSGSSKTKARREKEANDKRRKLSMAAMRAVRAAGGDVESLVEEGLFV